VAQEAVTRQLLLTALRGSRLWHGLRRIRPLRESVYLASETYSLLTNRGDDPDACERDFSQRDPWNFNSSPSELARFQRMRELVAPPFGALPWSSALEIGCAEGAFTELLAPYCRQLLCVDVSPTALERARSRREWNRDVIFENWNIRRKSPLGKFDLVVAACVLEYIVFPQEMRRMRNRLAGLLNPGGRLLVVSTRRNEVVEKAWWGRRLARGRWINEPFVNHPGLSVIRHETGPTHTFTLLERQLHG
jgi:SAM-dependent methyltransferase